MDKILTYTVREEDLPRTANGLVNLILKNCLRVTGHEISRSKFIPDGITADGRPVTVRQRLLPGQTLRLRLPDAAPSVVSGDRTPAPDTASAAGAPSGCLPPTEDTFYESDVPSSGSLRERVVPVSGPLSILYEDEDLIVVNKPAGTVVHPSHGHYFDSIANYLAFYYQEKGLTVVCHAIGRLDRDTSGALLFAKNRPAAARLTRQRQDGLFRRTYLALAQGLFPEKSGTVNLPLGPETSSLMKQRVYRPEEKGGKRAVTQYEVICSFPETSAAASLPGFPACTLLRLHLETGRTHQIRVHMAATGHPLLGDPLYSGDSTEERLPQPTPPRSPDNPVLDPTRSSAPASLHRAALHAVSVECVQPFTGENIRVEAPMAEDMREIIRTFSPQDRAPLSERETPSGARRS
ncbi:MAG: RluA family pseudouridine synthase [Eubacteriales bacterium]|nr:RluA family pseudouridine synthase [Eubacteriales bacterium]